MAFFGHVHCTSIKCGLGIQSSRGVQHTFTVDGRRIQQVVSVLRLCMVQQLMTVLKINIQWVFDTLVTAERRPKRQMVTQNDSESCK